MFSSVKTITNKPIVLSRKNKNVTIPAGTVAHIYGCVDFDIEFEFEFDDDLYDDYDANFDDFNVQVKINNIVQTVTFGDLIEMRENGIEYECV